MHTSWKTLQWYQPSSNQQAVPESIQSFDDHGLADEAIALEWENIDESREFLADIPNLTIDVLESSERVLAIVHPRAFRQKTEKQEEDFRHLMDTMKEALDIVAISDNERAARLAAKVYVHLRSSPLRYQRLFDGLLHKYTGVYHNTRRQHDPAES